VTERDATLRLLARAIAARLWAQEDDAPATGDGLRLEEPVASDGRVSASVD
jgi:hypothetical protein